MFKKIMNRPIVQFMIMADKKIIGNAICDSY